MDSRKLYLAANSLSNPKNSPADIVAPDRDIPGAMAQAWAIPTTSAFLMVSFSRGFLSSGLILLLTFSDPQSRKPVIIKNTPTAGMLLNKLSNELLNRTPAKPAGMVPIITSQASLLY